MNKGHYLDCIELLERNSRKSSYVKNQAEDLRRLVDEHYQLVEDHTKIIRSSKERTLVSRPQSNIYKSKFARLRDTEKRLTAVVGGNQ